MERYKLIAFDMDGTLLNSVKKIDSVTLNAIKEASLAGKIVALSTGRCMAELSEYSHSIEGLKYIIADNGAYIYELKTDKAIYKKSLAPEIVQNIFNQTEGMDVLCQLHSDNAIVQRDKKEQIDHYKLGIYRKLFEENMLMVDNIKDYYRSEHPSVYKFNIFSPDIKQRELLKGKFIHLPVIMCNSEYTGLEISPMGVSKGTGLKRLCEYLNIPIRSTIAVGDADNDIDILRTAGLSIAMGNGNENVKKAAKAIVRDNDNGGCAQAIYEYLMK